MCYCFVAGGGVRVTSPTFAKRGERAEKEKEGEKREKREKKRKILIDTRVQVLVCKDLAMALVVA